MSALSWNYPSYYHYASGILEYVEYSFPEGRNPENEVLLAQAA